MSIRRRLKKPEDSGVNVTPMLDIVFIMLIFFIVTATFLDVKGLDFTIPEERGGEGPEVPNIQIYVDAGNHVKVDGKPTDLANVPYAVESQMAFKPNAFVTLSAHYSADLNPVVRIKDRMEMAGRKTVFRIVREAQ